MKRNLANVVKWRGRWRRIKNGGVIYCLLVMGVVAGAGLQAGAVENTSLGHNETGTTTSSTPATGSSSDSSAGSNIYRGQSVQNVFSSFAARGGDAGVGTNAGAAQQQYYPTVNKCCPFFSRYERGECVQAQPNASRMMMMPDQPFWEAPKAMVTLLGKDLDGMEISNDTVVFR